VTTLSDLFQLQLKAGRHVRNYCPVSFRIAKNEPALHGTTLSAVSFRDDSGRYVPVQLSEDGEEYVLHWIIEALAANETVNYTVTDEPSRSAGSGIRFIEGENKLDVVIDGQYFTSYVYDPEVAKPYISSVIGPYGDSYTRLDFETKEHPHHRSIWVAIGDINGIDMWNEPAGRFGKQKVTGITAKVDGPVLSQLTSNQTWTSFEGKAQLEESRTITFYNTPAAGRFIDLEVTFTATEGPVTFGATKEAGPLGIRVAESMKVANGGTMVNSFGSVGEEECWGQRAQWCDYFGNVGGHTLGIAAFDHKDNEDYPTYWHIRNYGLLAANNLFFLGAKQFEQGQSISYKHRIYFHDGDTTNANVAEHYQDYIHPPVAKLLT
jgi:hypothetical protein